MLYSKFISCNCDFFKFWCGLGETIPMLSIRAFEVTVPFQNTYMCEAGFSSWWPQNKTLIIDLDWFPRMIWEYLFQPLFPENQILCVENKHERPTTEWLTGLKLFVIFQKRKNLNMAVYSFFQTFRPLIQLIQWYAGSHEIVLGISTTSANHFLKVFMLARKSISSRFHLRDWQVSHKHNQNWFQ